MMEHCDTTAVQSNEMRSFVSFMFAISLLSEIIFRAGWYD